MGSDGMPSAEAMEAKEEKRKYVDASRSPPARYLPHGLH